MNMSEYVSLWPPVLFLALKFVLVSVIGSLYYTW